MDDISRLGPRATVAERTTRLSREMRLMGADLGARDALQPGDELRES